MGKRLAVIGAGPKGVAIAAKAAALRLAGHLPAPPEVVVFEQHEAGAAWTGHHDYTDGEQPLCTPAERDLGFPYDPAGFGSSTVRAMLAEFSWVSYLMRRGGRQSYEQWVTRGRLPPPHRDFAAYLADAFVRSGAAPRIGEVTAVDLHPSGGWQISWADEHGAKFIDPDPASADAPFDGVVITGSGEPRAPLPGTNARVFDGRTIWRKGTLPRMAQLLAAESDPSIVIVGAGGIAAAVALKLLRLGLATLPIEIIGREPTLFARHPGAFEDRLFADDGAWSALAPHTQQVFLDRLTAGVVWANVLGQLVGDHIRYASFDLRDYVVSRLPPAPGQPDRLCARLDPPPDTTLVRARGLAARLGWRLPPLPVTAPVDDREAAVYIDARGFEPFTFANKLLPVGSMRNFFVKQGEAARANIAPDFGIRGKLDDGSAFPSGLHVPHLGTRHGPAAGNLMALGWLADRVLATYCG